RNAGDAVIKAWTTLSANDQKHIIDHSKKQIV
ncbi:unnamed protein product, partial [marine sediment metagenome]